VTPDPYDPTVDYYANAVFSEPVVTQKRHPGGVAGRHVDG
jgi:hypothetical protein